MVRGCLLYSFYRIIYSIFYFFHVIYFFYSTSLTLTSSIILRHKSLVMAMVDDIMKL